MQKILLGIFVVGVCCCLGSMFSLFVRSIDKCNSGMCCRQKKIHSKEMDIFVIIIHRHNPFLSTNISKMIHVFRNRMLKQSKLKCKWIFVSTEHLPKTKSTFYKSIDLAYKLRTQSIRVSEKVSVTNK